MSDFSIKDANSDAFVRFSRLLQIPRSEGRFSFVVSVEGSGIRAICDAEDYGSSSWSCFFTDLATNWKGWQGDKSIQTFDQVIGISATSDSSGHVRASITLRPDGAPPEWTLVAVITVEAGQLVTIANEAEKFFA